MALDAMKTFLVLWVILVLGVQSFGFVSNKYFSPFDYWDVTIVLSGLAFIPILVIGPTSKYWHFVLPFLIQLLICFYFLRWYLNRFNSFKTSIILYLTLLIFLRVQTEKK